MPKSFADFISQPNRTRRNRFIQLWVCSTTHRRALNPASFFSAWASSPRALELSGRRQPLDDRDLRRGLAPGRRRPVRAPLPEPQGVPVEVAGGVLAQTPGLRLHGRADRGAVAPVEVGERRSP